MVGPSSQISKILLTLLFLLIIFYIYMDVNLYLRIQNYPVERNYHHINNNFNNLNINNNNINNSSQLITTTILLTTITTINNNNNNLNNINFVNNGGSTEMTNNQSPSASSTLTSSSTIINYGDITWLKCDINPLCDVTVKSVMLDHTNHYLFAPMATIFDQIVSISKTDFITANMISFFHVFVAIGAGRMISSDSLGYRRFGVVLFQFRTFLDDLDGHIARTKKNIRGERSEIGTSGYYIDGICDGLGCIALMIGVFIFLKNNPPRRGYQQLQAIIPITETKNNNSEQQGVTYKVKVTTKKVVRKVLCFSGQLLLSSTAWNRYIALYQDMLERIDVTPMQYIRQNFIFKSKWFFSVAWLWRVFNVHALLHCLLLSIFCDKLWEFLRTIQYAGYIALLIIICISEMHVLEVQNFIFKSLTGNSTSL